MLWRVRTMGKTIQNIRWRFKKVSWKFFGLNNTFKVNTHCAVGPRTAMHGTTQLTSARSPFANWVDVRRSKGSQSVCVSGAWNKIRINTRYHMLVRALNPLFASKHVQFWPASEFRKSSVVTTLNCRSEQAALHWATNTTITWMLRTEGGIIKWKMFSNCSGQIQRLCLYVSLWVKVLCTCYSTDWSMTQVASPSPQSKYEPRLSGTFFGCKNASHWHRPVL